MVKGPRFDATDTPAPRSAVLCVNVQPLMLDAAFTIDARPPPAPPTAWLPLTTQSVMVKEVRRSVSGNAKMPPATRAELSVNREPETVIAPLRQPPPLETPAELPVNVDLEMVICAALLWMPPPLPVDGSRAWLPEKVQPLTVRAFTLGEA